MTWFVVICAAMIAATLVLIALPLARDKNNTRVMLPLLAVLVPALAIAIYWRVGHRTWEADETAVQAQTTAQRDQAALIARLEKNLRDSPESVDAALNLGEALIQQDERAIMGRAGELFEGALARAPDNAKAIYFAAMAALGTGKLPLARERLQHMLALNPPEQIRHILERQIQDITQQLGEIQPAASGKAISVEVSIPSKLAQGIDKTTSLFVLARDPANRGPPLAVVRKTVGDLPLSVTLTDSNAMMPGRGISTVARTQVVARISKSGTPQAQPGDLFGEATVELNDTKSIAIKIAIDKVEK